MAQNREKAKRPGPTDPPYKTPRWERRLKRAKRRRLAASLESIKDTRGWKR